MTRELWQRLRPLLHSTAHRYARKPGSSATEAAGVERKNGLHDPDEDAETQSRVTGDSADFRPLEQVLFGNGTVILDRFRIVCLLGRGGMGEVYEAIDLQLGRVALKTIHHGIDLSPGVLRQFRREVQLARRVSGPQVCRIHDLFMLPASGGQPAIPFLTMEYLDGVTLSQKLREDGPFAWKKALPIASEICAGLRLIHENGIIHCDLKCANIMLCEHGGSTRVVLMDFGLASRPLARDLLNGSADLGTDGSTLDGSRRVIAGTPQYMAPEQFEAVPLTPAADIYALGIILYELVTGQNPFAAHTPLAAAIRRARTPAPPSSIGIQVPRHWDRIIAKCLKFDPEQRFASAAEVARALSAGPATFNNIRKDRPWVLGMVGVVLAILAMIATYSWWQQREYYRPAPQALHWYETGVDAIHEGTYVKATDELKEALNQDPKFAMAHLRLAEAWENLDFETDALQEVASASPGEGGLTPLEHLYADAIRMTVSHDFAGAVDRYQAILLKLPREKDKADAYVDLGKAYERAGDPSHALEAYSQASKLDDQSASPCLRTAILQSRLNHVADAEAAFQHAEKLFKAEANQEGLAELDFQRGYGYNDHSDPAHAKIFLDKSLEEAKALGSVQLEIRARTQLSAALYTSGRAIEGAEQAKQAIQLARDNRIDSWAADGLGRLANAQIRENDLPGAEQSAREALQLASKSGQLRSQAFANFTIASIMDRKDKADQIIVPAQAALNYYRSHGFFKPAAYSALLLLRAQRDTGLSTQALESGNASLDVATKSGDPRLMLLSQEAVAHVYQQMEDLVHALKHYELAKGLADTPENIERQSEHCADVLWQLGRYAESDALLRDPGPDQTVRLAHDKIRIESLLSQGKYETVLSLSAKALSNLGDKNLEDRIDIQRFKAVAAAHLHHSDEAIRLMEASRPEPDDMPRLQSFKLMQPEVELFSGQPEKARATASEAADYFQKMNMPLSELRSVWLAALAAKRLGDTAAEKIFSQKGIDIAAQLQQNWDSQDPQAFQRFASRPDLQALSESK